MLYLIVACRSQQRVQSGSMWFMMDEIDPLIKMDAKEYKMWFMMDKSNDEISSSFKLDIE